MTDDELIERFENCTLPKEAFHHEDHIRVAFLYLSNYAPAQALQRFSESLARFANAHGKPDRYNETITWAYILLIRERMARTDRAQNWLEFEADNPDLLDYGHDILKKYYRQETLASPLAKKVFLFPDRL
jgi:hypothetical protein